jgi:endogenous inhibitor of DNA gyrase (YacG/DUF329 family)
MSDAKVRCPICNKESPWNDNPFRPFCSERCKMIDLGKWASEDYKIPTETKDHSEDDED